MRAGENISGKAEQKQCQGCHHYLNTTKKHSHRKLCRKDGERKEGMAQNPTVPKLGDLVQNKLLPRPDRWQVSPGTWGMRDLFNPAAEANLWQLSPVPCLLPPHFHRCTKSLPLPREQEAFTVFEWAKTQMILFLISLMSLLALSWWQVNEFALCLTSSYGNDLKPFVTMHQKYKVIKNRCPTMKLVID